MTLDAFHALLERATRDQALRERVVAVFDHVFRDSRLNGIGNASGLLMHGIGVAQRGTPYLRAAREYEEYMRGHGPHPAQLRHFLSLRGSLGARSRWLYAAQRKTFDDAIGVLTALVPGAPESLPRALLDACWYRLLEVERLWLTDARRNVTAR